MPERLPQLRQHLGLQLPETGLAVPGKDVRNGHSGPLRDEIVGLQHLPAQLCAKSRRHGGLAAAGHSDEDDIPQMSADQMLHPLQRSIVNGECR